MANNQHSTRRMRSPSRITIRLHLEALRVIFKTASHFATKLPQDVVQLLKFTLVRMRDHDAVTAVVTAPLYRYGQLETPVTKSGDTVDTGNTCENRDLHRIETGKV